jgi:hypothetical protein
MKVYLILLLVLLLIIFKKYKNKNNKSSFGSTNNVALITLMYKPKNVETWLDLHRSFGISHFYIRLEDTPELIDYLESQPDITLMVASSDKDKNQYLTLQTRQIETVDKVLNMCKQDNINWLIHIDCDEILSGDINEIKSLPESVGTFWMQNIEAVYNGVPGASDSCFKAKYYKDCGDSNSNCVSYVNGKGGGRIRNDVSCNGPHRFKSNSDEVKINVVVKHYESCDFDQYLKKYTRLKKGVNLETIPFEYYRESIKANGSKDKLKNVYKKYRVA